MVLRARGASLYRFVLFLPALLFVREFAICYMVPHFL